MVNVTKRKCYPFARYFIRGNLHQYSTDFVDVLSEGMVNCVVLLILLFALGTLVFENELCIFWSIPGGFYKLLLESLYCQSNGPL